jgi:peptide/nickel transport system substrate-binding protein
VKKLLFFALSIVIISAFVLSGCTKSSTTTTTAKPSTTTTAAISSTTTTAAKPSTTTTAATTDTPQYGGVLKIISNPGVTSLGYPGKATFPGEQVLEKPCIEFLLNRDPKTQQNVPELAISFGYNANFTAFTLTLRQGVKFHDGTDFNAEAVKYNLELVRKGARAADLKSVTSIDVVDNYTVRLNTTGYDNAFPDSFCGNDGGIVSPTYLKSLGPNDQFHPVGTGPYKFASYTPDVSLKFERFDGYWGGKPYLDGIEIIFVADPVTQLASFKAGEADVVKQMDITGALDIQAAGKFDIIKYPQQIWGIAGDGGHATSTFADIKVRQAVSYALDTDAIAKAVGRGFYATTNQWDKKDGLFYNPNVVGYPYNPQKAKDLLTQAGYPNGFQTKITLSSAVPTPDMMTMVQNYLSAVGIKATLDVVDPTKYNDVAKKGWDNQLLFYWIAAGNGVYDAFKSKMTSLSSVFDPKSFLLPTDFNTLYLTISNEPDPAKRVAIFQQLLKMATDQYCIATPILVNYYFKGAAKKVHNCDIMDYAINEWHPEKAWLSK